ncbi:MAG: Uncharacterised protein [Cellvibrionales bacterium UBA7375]|nr:MAG: Uncharacterised protein [Cellvibrionales bacterium UBA7375]
MMDDIYSFDQNGEFSYDQFGETYNHYGQSVYDISGCQPPSAPWDGAGSYSYNFNEQTAKLTVIGKGAYIGLSYIANGIYRIDEAYFAPDEVTYDFTKINNDEIILEIDAHTSIHRFTMERVLGN